MTGRIIAVLNQKGGAGKTTTAVNLAAAFSAAGKRTLLIDCDPQGHATVHLGCRPPELPRTTYDLLLGEVHPAELCLKVDNGSFLIPSNLKVSVAEVELLHRLGREQILRRRLQSIRDEFDYVLLDCPPSLGMLTINALCASEELIIPVPADYFGLEGMVQLVDTLRLLRVQLAHDVGVAGVLLTRYDARRGLAREVREAASGYGFPMFQTFIRENVKLAEAPSTGKDIFRYDPRSHGAEDYGELAKEYLNATIQ